MTDYLDETFGPGGTLASKLVGYRQRPGQLDYARAVHKALEGGRQLLAEGPTGVGKSVGYLVPATKWAVEKQKTVLVVTANISLQEQLITKDLPFLASVLPWKFTYALLKGRNNYLCLKSLAKVEQRGAKDEAEAAIMGWAALTQTGDKSDLPFNPDPRTNIWGNFSVTGEECTGDRCRFVEDCHAERAQGRARLAQVIVTNYAMLFLDVAVREATAGKSGVLPEYSAIVADEAHESAEWARQYLGYRLSTFVLRDIAKALGTTDLSERLMKASAEFFHELAQHRKSPTYKRRIRQANVAPSWQRLVELLGAAKNFFAGEAKAAVDEEDHDAAHEMRRFKSQAERAAKRVREAMTDVRGETVHFIEEDKGRVALCGKPISVAGILRERLFNKPAVLTSATLSVGGSFKYVADELGVPEDRDEIIVESPFDWKRQAVLVVPEMPSPKTHRVDHVEACARSLVDVVRLAKGRTLALFTSYAALDKAHAALSGSGCHYQVLRQGEMPVVRLVEAFRSDVSSVLLGTNSLWTGVDVQGEALSCLVIDKLPFASPDDPVLDALSEREGPAFFTKYAVPRAVIALKQGFGRLVRTESDRGVVVVLDPRIVTEGYGRLFLRSLPGGIPMTRDLRKVGEFLGGST